MNNHNPHNKTFNQAELEYWNEKLPLKALLKSLNCQIIKLTPENNFTSEHYLVSHFLMPTEWSIKRVGQKWETSCYQLEPNMKLIKTGGDILDMFEDLFLHIPKTDEETRIASTHKMYYHEITYCEDQGRNCAREFVRRKAVENFGLIFLPQYLSA